MHGCMRTDLVGSSSTSFPHGLSRTGETARFEYGGTEVFNVDRHGLCGSPHVDTSDPAHGCIDNIIPLQTQQMTLLALLKWQS